MRFNHKSIKTEVCAFSLESCLAAEKGGAIAMGGLSEITEYEIVYSDTEKIRAVVEIFEKYLKCCH